MKQNDQRNADNRKKQNEVNKDEAEVQRIQRDGQGGDNTSEMLEKWREERIVGLEYDD